MQSQAVSPPSDAADPPHAMRLHYLDCLRVLSTLGVFLFHASNVFNTAGFEIKNAEQSDLITLVDVFFYPWGMPLFFLVAGAGSWFALRRRTAGQFTRERTLRLLVPFFTGTLLLGPLQLYLSWRHRVEVGAFTGPFLDFIAARLAVPGPKLFGAIGYHMWFLGFLFAYSLLALPLFIWLKGEAGRASIARLARWSERRGGVLLPILPLAVVRLGLQPFFPELQSWADFAFFGVFFVLGFVLFADERFLQTIRRDWAILLAVGLAAFLVGAVIGFSGQSFGVENPLRTAWDVIMWALIVACGWCWAALMLVVGMHFLNQESAALRYSQGVILPFFVVHQPVILAIAYVVVPWQAGIPAKLLIVVIGGVAASLALSELIIRRVRLLRLLFGMKAGQAASVRPAMGSGL